MVHLEQKAGDSSSERLWMTSSLGTKPWPRMSDCQVLRQLVYGIGEKNFHQPGSRDTENLLVSLEPGSRGAWVRALVNAHG